MQIAPPRHKGCADSRPAWAIFDRPGSDTGSVGTSSYQTTSVVERLLLVNGFSPGAVDGLLDNRTRQAIRAFQRQNGMHEDGQVTVQLVSALTSHALDLIPGSAMQLSLPQSSNAVVRQNVLRANLALIQRVLARNGFQPGRIDGQTTSRTDQAIRTYQFRVGLPVTGDQSSELVSSLREFDRHKANLVLSQNGSVLQRPGFAADRDIGDNSDLEEGWSLKAIANSSVIPVDGASGAVRIGGFLAANEFIDNPAVFSYDLGDLGGTPQAGLGFDRIALNWGGFLQVENTGAYEFAIQTFFADQASTQFCDVALMLNEEDELFQIINRRVDGVNRHPNQITVFLEQGWHQIELWSQCERSSFSSDFAISLLMRAPDDTLLEPIPDADIRALSE